MRNYLMTGTALVAATMLVAGGASAADKKMEKPTLSVGGYVDAVLGGVLNEEQKEGRRDAAEDTSALDSRTDGEIHFNGRATLDNGLKMHMRVELEGQNAASDTNKDDLIDEYFLAVSGSFGKIILGGTGGAPLKLLTGLSGSWATGVGESLAYNSGSWVGSAAEGTFGVIQNARLQDQDADKATYISPKFGGFQIGLSYSPDQVNDGDNTRINAETGRHNGLEGALSYTGTFGDVSFGLGAGMTAYQGASKKATGSTCVAAPGMADGASATTKCTANKNPTSDQSDWVVAGRLDFGGGFRVSAAHKRTTNDDKATQGQMTDVGARFITGSNQFSVVGSMGEMDVGGAQYTAVMGSYARILGPGTKVHTNLIWNQSDNGKRGDDKNENTGLAMVTGLTVSF